MTLFSYVRLPDNMSKVTCVCGWEDEPMPVGPFDPEEALVAARAGHPQCALACARHPYERAVCTAIVSVMNAEGTLPSVVREMCGACARALGELLDMPGLS